jgi:hypothetical protein
MALALGLFDLNCFRGGYIDFSATITIAGNDLMTQWIKLIVKFVQGDVIQDLAEVAQKDHKMREWQAVPMGLRYKRIKQDDFDK